jgi:hypothetical protein
MGDYVPTRAAGGGFDGLLLLLTLCLALDIPGGAVIEVVFAVFFDDLLVALRLPEFSDMFEVRQ